MYSGFIKGTIKLKDIIGLTYDEFKIAITPYCQGLEVIANGVKVLEEGFTVSLWSIVLNYYANENIAYDTQESFLRAFALKFIGVWSWSKGVLQNYYNLINEKYEDLFKKATGTKRSVERTSADSGKDTTTSKGTSNADLRTISANMPTVEGLEPVNEYADQNSQSTNENNTTTTTEINHGLQNKQTENETIDNLDHQGIFQKMSSYVELGGVPIDLIAKKFASLFITYYIYD